MKTDHDIRPLTHEDYDRWRPLWERYLTFYKSTVPENTTALLWRRFLDPQHPFKCFVAESRSAKNLEGFVHYFPHPDTWEPEPVCYLQDLYVNEDMRGNGIGAELIHAVAAEAKRQSWTFVYWQTQDNNTRARGLYDILTGGTDGFVTYRLGARTAGAMADS